MNIVETAEVKKRTLTQDGDTFRMKIPVLQADQVNQNKRTYPLSVVKKAVQEFKARLAKRNSFGSTSHVPDMELDHVSHVIEDVEVDEKGLAQAVVKILPTTKGKNLSTILKAGGAVGVSARGTGSVDKKGNVGEDFRLLGVDFTLAPSFAFHVNRNSILMFESAPVDQEDNSALAQAKGYKTLDELNEAMAAGVTIEQDPEKVLRLKYMTAKTAGYKGDFTEFKESFNRTVSESLLEEKFEQAIEAGYKGDFKSFKETLKKG